MRRLWLYLVVCVLIITGGGVYGTVESIVDEHVVVPTLAFIWSVLILSRIDSIAVSSHTRPTFYGDLGSDEQLSFHQKVFTACMVVVVAVAIAITADSVLSKFQSRRDIPTTFGEYVALVGGVGAFVKGVQNKVGDVLIAVLKTHKRRKLSGDIGGTLV